MNILNGLQNYIGRISGFAAKLLKPQKADEAKGRWRKYVPDKKTACIIAISAVLALIVVYALFIRKRRKTHGFSGRESAEESICLPAGTDWAADGAGVCETSRASIKPRKKTKSLFFLFAAVLSVCALLWVFKGADYFSQMKKNALINETVKVVAGDTSASLQTPARPLMPPSSVPEIPQDAPDFPQDGEDEFEPEPEAPKEVLESIIRLRDVFSNDDIVALLKVEGTSIEYAVAQSADNEFYLNHDLYGAYNSAGSIFMDYECDPLSLSRNTVIYGHNMRNGTMFHNIRYYAQKEFYDNNRFIHLTTPYEETVWEIFSFYQTDTGFYYIQVLFKNDEEFQRLVSQMKDKSIYETGVSVDKDDKVLTLSTCANTPDDARLVLNAKLVSTGHK